MFTISKLLLNGFVWQNPNLSTKQVKELDRRAEAGLLIKERAMWPGYSVGQTRKTLWRVPKIYPNKSLSRSNSVSL